MAVYNSDYSVFVDVEPCFDWFKVRHILIVKYIII